MSDKAQRIRKMKLPPVPPELRHRLPPGQVLTERFPILHEGDVPQYDMDRWTLRVFGAVEQEIVFTYQDVLSMPRTERRVDIHCVTRWSKFDTTWSGVRFRDLLAHVHVQVNAKHVMLHGANGYEANVPLAELMGENVVLADQYDGAPLTPKHGYPLRLVVPHLYFWKSVKWLEGIELMTADRPGFWEQNGFHNEADPFREERFSGEALPIPEDEWERKEYD